MQYLKEDERSGFMSFELSKHQATRIGEKTGGVGCPQQHWWITAYISILRPLLNNSLHFHLETDLTGAYDVLKTSLDRIH